MSQTKNQPESYPMPVMRDLEDSAHTPMSATQDYADQWLSAGEARWWMEQPDYEDEPDARGFGGVGPITGQDLLPAEVVATLTPTYLHFLNRCWGVLAQIRHPDWPAVHEGARPGAWAWVDPIDGPRKYLEMMVLVGEHVVDMTHEAQEIDRKVLSNTRRLLAGDPEQIPGYIPAPQAHQG